jgi:hypothetical protein
MTNRTPDDPSVSDVAYQAGWEAGVEAERARAAAEATEEWGTRNPMRLTGADACESREHAERRAAWHMREMYEPMQVVRRTVGPWEVQP